jgi:hypothetical protein
MSGDKTEMSTLEKTLLTEAALVFSEWHFGLQPSMAGTIFILFIQVGVSCDSPLLRQKRMENLIYM